MRKIFKLIFLILVLCCVMTIFAACDPNRFSFDYEELKENVVRVELIYYDNPDAKELFEKRDKVIPFDFSKMEIVEVLSENEVDNFLHDLSKRTFLEVWRHLDSPQGYSIRLVYLNEDFEIISCNAIYSGGFYADGQVKRFIGNGLNSDLFNKYFETKIG